MGARQCDKQARLVRAAPPVEVPGSHANLDLAATRQLTMLTIGQLFPSYSLKAVVSNDLKDAFIDVDSVANKGDWQVWFFWPKDFTFVCPTEIKAFGELQAEFADRDAKLFGASTDSEFVHLAWRRDHADLEDLPFPMVSDLRRELSGALGILDRDELVAMRATFIVDPMGVIRFVAVNDMNVGRNPAEVLRVLDALQTDELCPCNWQKGDEPLQVA
jgi:peroxiredoxin (alkyl hydroperoxide reductase subunit C)